MSTLYEIVVTIMDYQFKLMGVAHVSRPRVGTLDDPVGTNSGGEFADLMGHFGQLTNGLSFLVSFFGFSFFVRKKKKKRKNKEKIK